MEEIQEENSSEAMYEEQLEHYMSDPIKEDMPYSIVQPETLN